MAIENPVTGQPIVLGGGAGLPGQSAYQLWLAAGNSGTLDDYQATLVSTVPGPKGDPSSVPGPPGTGTTTTRVAASAIPASTYVVDQPGLQCAIADPTNPAHRGKVLGLVVQATPIGQQATIQSIGAIAGVVGAFNPGDPLYIGDGITGPVGSIVNVPPSAGWRQNVGTATTANLINALLGEARLINTGSALVLSGGAFATVSDLGRSFVEATPTAVVTALLSILDALPQLPTDPANYPAGGGLFLNGDANAWTLVRLLPKV